MKNNMFYKSSKGISIKIILILIAILLLILFIINIKNKENTNPKTTTKKVKTMTKTNNLGVMPTWDLSDLYTNLNDHNINKDILKLNQIITFFQSYKGKVKLLTDKQLYTAITEYEEIETLMAKLSSFAYLKYAENLSIDDNVKFYQKITEELSTLSSQLVFFTLELNNITDKRPV